MIIWVRMQGVNRWWGRLPSALQEGSQTTVDQENMVRERERGGGGGGREREIRNHSCLMSEQPIAQCVGRVTVGYWGWIVVGIAIYC